MNVIVKLPVEIPEETINELAKRAAEELENDDRDLVPVVRCRDCVFYNSGGRCSLEKERRYMKFNHEMRGDDFCSHAERRNET